MNAKFVHRTILIALLLLTYPAASFAGFFGVGISVGFAPPPRPVYVQPPCPAPGYIWTPGYWAYSEDDQDYYWVPGTWVRAPAFGLLWTPGYWGLVDAQYVWHEGYWGPHVGFYGGINYGFGYFGSGFDGGYWRDRNFYYNRAVTNVSNVNVTTVYNRTVINNNFYGSRPSFNGRNGVEARPTQTERLWAHEPHRAPTTPQRSQAETARTLPTLLASVNHGHPQLAATPQPGVFHGQGVAAPRYSNATPAPSSHLSLADRGRGQSFNRSTALYSSSMHARPQSSATPQDRSAWGHPQHEASPAPAQHAGYGPPAVRTAASPSRPPLARSSPPASFQPAQQYRVPSYAPPRAPQVRAWNPAAHSPPGRQAFAQVPHNAPAFHHDSQPPHVNHQPTAPTPRHS